MKAKTDLTEKVADQIERASGYLEEQNLDGAFTVGVLANAALR